MKPLTFAVRLWMALMIAVPLGPGGLCCCLLGAAQATACDEAPAEPRGCCSESAPAQTPDADCDCPIRDVVILVGADVALALEAPPAATPFVPAPAPGLVRIPAAAPSAAAPALPPPRAVPLFRTLSVIRC